MSSYSFISPEDKAYARFLREREQLSFRKIAELTGVSKSSVARLCRRRSNCHRGTPEKGPACRKGRPTKLSVRQKRTLIKEFHKTRTSGNFNVRTLRLSCGLRHVSDTTVYRFLNRSGYRYYQARKKGLLFKRDLRQRLQFAREIKRAHGDSFWTENIWFYFDSTAFHHKSQPREHAKTLTGRVWRKRTEGLSFGCTAKGRKVGSGGRVVRVHAAVAYGHGVVLAKPYRKLSAKRFAKFVKKEFPAAFDTCQATRNTPRMYLQDGDPSQNSERARKELRRLEATALKIPPRSPDLNPIENVFKLLGDQLKKDAIQLNIEHESFRAFKRRVLRTLRNLSPTTIDRTIASMGRRITDIIRRKGQRLKY